MKKILIIEDNRQNLQALEMLVQEAAPGCMTYAVASLTSAYRIAAENEISLFLIDIILEPEKYNDTSGIQFAQWLRQVNRYHFTPIIFTTSLEDPLLYAYRHLHCYGYLEKPYDPCAAKELIAEALNFPTAAKLQPEAYFYFRKEGILYPRKLSEIVYIENVRRRLIVHMADGEELIMPYCTISALLKELNAPCFLQCSRSTILNRDYIDNIDLQNRYIHLKNCSQTLEIGTILKKRFLEDLNKI